MVSQSSSQPTSTPLCLRDTSRYVTAINNEAGNGSGTGYSGKAASVTGLGVSAAALGQLTLCGASQPLAATAGWAIILVLAAIEFV